MHYLVVGNDAGSKVAKAEKLGMQTIDAPTFLKMSYLSEKIVIFKNTSCTALKK